MCGGKGKERKSIMGRRVGQKEGKKRSKRKNMRIENVRKKAEEKGRRVW